MRLPILYSLFAVFATACLAAVIEFNELKDKPAGLAKDYYINRLITETKPTKEQAKTLAGQIYRKAGLVQKNIAKLVSIPPEKGRCEGYGLKNILDANLSCQDAITNLNFSQRLSAKIRERLADNLAVKYPKKAQILLALNAKNPVEIFKSELLTEPFLTMFNSADNLKKVKILEGEFSDEFMDKFYSQKGFTQFLVELVIGKKFASFRQNLLKISPDITAGNDAFLLGLNAITLGNDARAAEYFTKAATTFERAWQRDNAKFWLYLINKDKKILEDIAKSEDINIYSLYARDFIDSPPFEVVVPRPTKQKIENFDVTDPFLWQKTAALAKDMNASEAREFAQQFYTNESIGAYAFFMQKATNWETNYFLMPNSPELEDTNATRKAMIYALARQESMFLPSVISTSYALGTMQFMPFLANHIGKDELKIENFDQDDMFKPDVAYKFANFHLDYLERFLQHPLFIAYAYNGGIGYTKRLITREDMFKEGKYEPFLSMELAPVTETRNYGKKVLANYVIYSSLMGSNIKISQLFEILSSPDLTDKFRK